MKKIVVTVAALVSSGMALAEESRSFNPAISLILQGQYADYREDPEEYSLPGFMMGHESGLLKQGIGLGHNELVMSATVDNHFQGKMTTAIAEHDGETEIELEEAFVETLGLGNGFTVKAGRFMSNFGYLNNQHGHAWDFVDAPLVYRGLFGKELIDDGVQVRWLAPTPIYVQLGAELGRGERFPAGGAKNNGLGAKTIFAELGGDLNQSHSWQLGLSHWRADVAERSGDAHDHGGAAEISSFSGTSKVSALDLVWKWAPEGNRRERNFKAQFEYMVRDEDGEILMEGSDPLESSSYQGRQKGWYAQGVYQFMPSWRVGLRYDSLNANNKGDDMEVLGEANLDAAGHRSRRTSAMIDFAPSEFSNLRLQYNRDRSQAKPDDQFFLQYTMSLGAHGAHQF